jgi:hypothetical protein
MRKLLSFGFLLSLAAVPCFAQSAPRWDVAAGYTYYNAPDGGTEGRNLNGGSASVAYNINRWLGAVAEVAVAHTNDYPDFSNTLQSYSVGARFSYRKHDHFTPFGEILGGLGRNTVTYYGQSNSFYAFAMNAAAGVDIGLGSKGKFALRPEIGYALFANEDGSENGVRVSFGFVYNIGQIGKK